MKIKLNCFLDIMEFVKIARKYDFDVDMNKGSISIDAKDINSVIGIDPSNIVEIVAISENEGIKNDFYKKIQKWEMN